MKKCVIAKIRHQHGKQHLVPLMILMAPLIVQQAIYYLKPDDFTCQVDIAGV
jgi:hypothetical protein